MCGIVGFSGTREAAPILLEGLKRLEYRGYDSAGIAVQNAGRIDMAKPPAALKTSAKEQTTAPTCTASAGSRIPAGDPRRAHGPERPSPSERGRDLCRDPERHH
jgi:glucosamine--fructose-6-phosphate aminotransferase (isomerizing)